MSSIFLRLTRLFGTQTAIYQYDPVEEIWILRDEKLMGSRGKFGMVMVDESFLNC